MKKTFEETPYIIEVNFEDQDKYVVRFPEHKGIIGCGDDLLEAIMMAKEALEMFLEYLEEGETNGR